mgnify:CR=1 FL=1|jgi:hypothetical protein
MRFRLACASLAAAASLTACRGLLEVDNPNNLLEEDLTNPAAAPSIANGASATLARALGAVLGIYSTATDEITWIGSRDAWRELDLGDIGNPRNEFTDDAFRYMAQARWMTDEAVKRLEGFDQQGQLLNRADLARSYLYAAIAYITIADMFDDFAFSDRRTPQPPIGRRNMGSLYDRAVDYATKGLTIARAVNNAELQRALLAVRARARFSKQVWQKITPPGQVNPNPLVNDPQANADAQAALDLMGPTDYKFKLKLATDDLAYAGEVSLAYNVNQRAELTVAPAYGRIRPQPTVVNLRDPITGQPDPVIDAELRALVANYVNQEITVVSAREMRLILAEAALAQNNPEEFRTQINAIRAFNGLPPYTGQIPTLDMLKHTRRVNLFLQGRRLADLYRFGDRAPEWLTNPPAAAVRAPGTLFPVACIEVRSHPQDFPNLKC